jgi:hypothetical protein
MKPTRKIGLSNWSLTGKVGSTKNSRMHDFESSLERDLLITLEFDGFVESFCEQPVCIEYLHDGTTRRYTPDVIVYYRKDVEAVKHLKPMLCEIKYRADLKEHWQELKPKYMAALRYASQQGWRFKILTEKEIRTEYQWNAKFLTSYRKPMVGEIDAGDFTLLLQTVEQLYHTTPKQVMMAAVRDEWKRAELLYVLWYMIANGFVKCDLSRKLTMDTEIWLH